MKPANTHIATSANKARALILLGTLAAVITTVECSNHSKPGDTSSISAGARFRPAVLQTTMPAVAGAEPAAVVKKTSAKPSAAKPIAYRSRDYGVSFVYPWQYAFVSAKAVADGGESLKPKSDGHDGQFTLARVEVPKGFYSDTNYESGYFTVSLNQDLSEQECNSVLGPGKDDKVETINGIEFRRMDTDNGGHGRATMLRQYVTFTNGTCYELELGVKTSNENGLAREVDPEQVLRRLDAVLKTVKILPADRPAATVVESSTAVPQVAPASQDSQK
jgi:hypothetical protein